MANLDGYLTIVGHLGREPEIRNTPNADVCKFSVAVNHGKEGAKTTWHNVVTFNQVAKACALALHKGDPVIVVGHIRTREYEGKWYTELIADFVGKTLFERDQQQQAAPAQKQEETPPPEYDDIPF